MILLKILFVTWDLLVTTFQPQASFPPSNCVLSRSLLLFAEVKPHPSWAASCLLSGLPSPNLVYYSSIFTKQPEIASFRHRTHIQEHNCICTKRGNEKTRSFFLLSASSPNCFPQKQYVSCISFES